MGAGCDMMLVTALDDIAWMLNLRGNDITYNPLFFSYVIFHRDASTGAYRADLFIDQAKVQDADVLQHLASNNISVFNYGDTAAKLQEYSPTGGVKISVDKSQVNLRLWSELKSREY
jgi:Xaa-Pro aminopeptidase